MSSSHEPNAPIQCVECGLLLPIRRPKPDENHRTFGCTFCGAIYAGIPDETANADERLNAREIDLDSAF